MPGWLTDSVPNLTTTTGNEQASFDTQASGGANPQTGSINLQQLANLVSFYGNGLDKTMVAGSIYYSSITFGFPAVLTGLSVRVGGTGGTDDWNVGLYSAAGALLATSVLTGTIAGTAETWQQIPFTATYNLTVPGTYFVALQSGGTTAKFDSINAPTSPTLTGSKTGGYGTWTSITPPTTYTANLGPRMLPY